MSPRYYRICAVEIFSGEYRGIFVIQVLSRSHREVGYFDVLASVRFAMV